MSYGGDSVTFVGYTDTGTVDDYGEYEQAETLTVATGCRHRTLRVEETPQGLTDIGTRIWLTTIPVGEYSAAVRAVIDAVQPDGEIRVDGVTYQIIGGPEHHTDMDGAPCVVKIMSHRQEG